MTWYIILLFFIGSALCCSHVEERTPKPKVHVSRRDVQAVEAKEAFTTVATAVTTTPKVHAVEAIDVSTTAEVATAVLTRAPKVHTVDASTTQAAPTTVLTTTETDKPTTYRPNPRMLAAMRVRENTRLFVDAIMKPCKGDEPSGTKLKYISKGRVQTGGGKDLMCLKITTKPGYNDGVVQATRVQTIREINEKLDKPPSQHNISVKTDFEIGKMRDREQFKAAYRLSGLLFAVASSAKNKMKSGFKPYQAMGLVLDGLRNAMCALKQHALDQNKPFELTRSELSDIVREAEVLYNYVPGSTGDYQNRETIPPRNMKIVVLANIFVDEVRLKLHSAKDIDSKKGRC